MAKNLTDRWRKLAGSMKSEEMNETANNETIPPSQTGHVEESLPEGHNPDLGEPEVTPSPPVSEEERLRQEAAEWKDKFMRLFAEFDNFRKRSARERTELFTSASADMIKELLPILDDFDRAVKANEVATDLEAVKEGFTLIHQKMYRKLESRGLKPIEAQGKAFDTDFHEAITSIPAPSPEGKGMVIDEVEKGYTLHEKVIRFSKVIIGQ